MNSIDRLTALGGEAVAPVSDAAASTSEAAASANEAVAPANEAAASASEAVAPAEISAYVRNVKGQPKVSFTLTKNMNSIVRLKWKKQKCSGYEVFRNAGGKWERIKRVKAPRFTDRNLTKGTYKYKVRAFRKYKQKGKVRRKYGKFSRVVRLEVEGDGEGPEGDDNVPSELAGTTIHFYTPVNVKLPATGPGPLDPKKDRQIDYDPSVLMLPDNYLERQDTLPKKRIDISVRLD